MAAFPNAASRLGGGATTRLRLGRPLDPQRSWLTRSDGPCAGQQGVSPVPPPTGSPGHSINVLVRPQIEHEVIARLSCCPEQRLIRAAKLGVGVRRPSWSLHSPLSADVRLQRAHGPHGPVEPDPIAATRWPRMTQDRESGTRAGRRCCEELRRTRERGHRAPHQRFPASAWAVTPERDVARPGDDVAVESTTRWMRIVTHELGELPWLTTRTLRTWSIMNVPSGRAWKNSLSTLSPT